MFERKVVNTHDERAGRQRRRGKLNMENVHGIAAQRSAQRQGYAYQRRVRQSLRNGKVGPASAKAIHGLALGNIQRVLIDRVELSQRFDQIDGVAFVPGQPSANGMGVYGNVQEAACSVSVSVKI